MEQGIRFVDDPDRPRSLEGLRVIVTGSSRGLGEAVARTCAARGARVVINGTDAARCAQVAADIGGVHVAGSVADERVADQLVEACCDAFGGVDALVNNAGTTRDRGFLRMSADDFDDVVRVHLRGTWLMSQRVARAMGGGSGSIVNVISGTALYGNPGQSNYAAAKGGVLSLTRSLSLELAPRGVRVNAISPIARTVMTEPLFALSPDAEEQLGGFFGSPEDVAELFAYLVSPASQHLSGQVLGFNGRELVVWSHPEPLRTLERDARWEARDLSRALGADATLARLHPDGLSKRLGALLAKRARPRS